MSRIQIVGSESIVAVLRLKYNSRNKFTLFFWDDVADTIASSLTGATITIEIDDPVGLVTWSSVIAGNGATFDQNAASVQFSWDAKPWRLIIVKSTVREVVMSGEVEVQR